MYRRHSVGVVVPAYNEEGFVGEVVETVPAFVDRIYVVDDASTDGTWAEIRRHAELVDARDGPGDAGFDPKVVAVLHDRNQGAGGAIRTGYCRALEDGLDVVATMDGDGQMDPDVLDRLLDPVVEGRADYAKMNRLLRRGRETMPRHRFVGNVVLGALTRIASGYWETGDPQTGYTAISRRALEAIDVEGIYGFYGYCNDVLVKLNVEGMRVVDVPAPPSYGDEESHIRFHSYVPKVSWMLLRNFLWRLKAKYVVRGFHPLVAVYFVGTLSVAAGIAGVVASVALVEGPARTAVAVGVWSLALALGVLAWAWAMVLDREVNAGLDGPDERALRTERPADAPVGTQRRLDQAVVDGGQEPVSDRAGD